MKPKGLEKRNRRGFIFIYAYLLIVLFMVYELALLTYFAQNINAFERFSNNTIAYQLAEAGLDSAMAKLKNNQIVFDANGNYTETRDFILGNYNVTVSNQQEDLDGDGALDGPLAPNTYRITTLASAPAVSNPARPIQQATNVVAYVRKESSSPIRGAVTVENRLIIGELNFIGPNNDSATFVVIDGRDHDIRGSLTGGPGTYGISTSTPARYTDQIATHEAVQSTGRNAGMVGGNGTELKNIYDPEVAIETDATRQRIANPDDLLGLPRGSFNRFKSNRPPDSPFRGIFFYSPSAYDSWYDVPEFNLGTSANPSVGILVVHNPSNTMPVKLSGHFKGLIISDRNLWSESYTDVVGAALFTEVNAGDPSLPDDDHPSRRIGNAHTIKTSDAFFIKYSSEVLSYLPALGNSEMNLVSWRTVPIETNSTDSSS